MNGQAGSEPKLMFPGLAGFYAVVAELWYPMIRIVAGSFLLSHGWGKVAAGQFTIGSTLAKYGIEPSGPLGYVVVFNETIGAICVILGLGTRFFAAAIAIEMAIIAFVAKGPLGFAQMEMFLLFGVVFFAIALRGGGPYSLDRKIEHGSLGLNSVTPSIAVAHRDRLHTAINRAQQIADAHTRHHHGWGCGRMPLSASLRR